MLLYTVKEIPSAKKDFHDSDESNMNRSCVKSIRNDVAVMKFSILLTQYTYTANKQWKSVSIGYREDDYECFSLNRSVMC
jgi:hypothetical protein